MKATNHFKHTIQNYLEQRVASDTLFERSYTNPNKNIDDCITYILNTVQKSGCNGFTDIEIYSLAVHYYDEDTIEIGKPMNNAHVIVNHIVELTEEEREQMRKDALQQVHDEAYNKLRQPKKQPITKATAVTNQLSLF